MAKPTKQSLQSLIDNIPDPSMVETVRSLIAKDNLTFELLKSPEGIWIVTDARSQGQQFLDMFITQDDMMIEMKRKVGIVMTTPYPVLITGETGTGKELIANSMIGSRVGGIKSINCAAIPETLLESELFGYKRGAFTGADTEKKGLFEAAKDGLLFLDEIGEMPLLMQSKLLRVLENKKIRPLGGVMEVDVSSTRVVAATNRDMTSMIASGKFMIDLYARLSTFEFHCSPLKDRVKDIEAICISLDGGKEFWEKHGVSISEMRLDLNVRSLQRYIIRNKVLGEV